MILQILGLANISLLLIALLVIFVSIFYGFTRGRASLAMLLACVIVFFLQMISAAVGSSIVLWSDDLTLALSRPVWMILQTDLAEDPFFFLGSLFAPLTSIFLHGGFSHIFFNMIFLFFIGLPLEQRIGNKNFMWIYLISGLVGSFCQYATGIPGIGASGALMGLFGAFAYLYPHERFVVFPFFIPIPATLLLLLLVGIDAMYGIIGAQTGIAHLAHLGGVFGGIAVAYFLKKQKDKIGTTGARIRTIRKKKKLNVYGLYTITPDLELIQDAAREEIPEVKKVKIESIVARGICPQCGSKPEIKGNTVVCRSCGYSFSLYE
ncbi:MAG: rhomboid family intramembrane serine protease [Candidatus Thermoplasmatota archaeon]|nr:rhomboid family intramembrane serine protease [Candidatus Thermoplasmatota archaeon]